MLVLSRKAGERIRIGSDIEVVVVRVSKNRVRIGISAPIEVPVHRHELARRSAGEVTHTTPLASEALETQQGSVIAVPVTELDHRMSQEYL